LVGAGVTVMHVYDGEAHEHVGPDREELAVEMEEYWTGHAHPMASFEAGEFRDDAGHVW
jgi:metallophosphoesterase superfamily enzyme